MCVSAALIWSWLAFAALDKTGAGEPEPKLQRHEFRQAHMGTLFTIVLYTDDPAIARTATEAAFERIAQLDAMLSDYRDDSELTRLCRQSNGSAIPVSDEFFFVLDHAQSLARGTDGAFDVTVGPVVRLWRRARRMHQLPQAERLEQAKALVGHELMELDQSNKTVRLAKSGMQLDLGGIAKGYAADEAIAVLKRHGVSRSLVAASGDVVMSDPPPGEPGWTVGVAPLDDPKRAPTVRLVLSNQAVSTSGDTEQFVEIDGTRYSHIVDPRTGIGLTTHSSVTVVAPRGIMSDSLATAASVLGPMKGLELIEDTPDCAALFVYAAGSTLETLESTRFKRLPKRNIDAPSTSHIPLLSTPPGVKPTGQ